MNARLRAVSGALVLVGWAMMIVAEFLPMARGLPLSMIGIATLVFSIWLRIP